MTPSEAKLIVGTDLGEPRKMPGYAFGIPAQACITGAKLHDVPDSVCAKCYAWNRGNYAWKNVQAGLYRRLENLDHPRWVEAMVTLISWRDCAYFRWHDSGDLQTAAHLNNIAEVARQLPRVKFWLPTREYAIVRAWFDLGNKRPKNLIIRLSAHMLNGPMPLALARKYGVLVSGVHTKDNPKPFGKVCDAKDRGGECGPCRACWDLRVKAITYPKH